MIITYVLLFSFLIQMQYNKINNNNKSFIPSNDEKTLICVIFYLYIVFVLNNYKARSNTG